MATEASTPLVRECVSKAESAAGCLEPAKLARLRDGWLESGLAVLANVIPQHALDAIEARLDYDAAHRYVHGDIFKQGSPRCTDADYFERGHDRNFQLGLPRHAPHFESPEIWANPIIEQVRRLYSYKGSRGRKMSLCTAADPRHTICSNMIGTSISEATMRPDSRSRSRYSAAIATSATSTATPPAPGAATRGCTWIRSGPSAPSWPSTSAPRIWMP
jgi:hypothetical protein